MILFILSYLSAFILGMLIMGVLWYSKWEEIIANEKKISIKLYEENIHCYNQLAQVDRLINDLGSEEMQRQFEEILEQNDIRATKLIKLIIEKYNKENLFKEIRLSGSNFNWSI